MDHLDDDTLALMALGERVDEPAAAHVEACARELASLTATARLGRQSVGVERLSRPDSRVWDAISSELGLGDAAPADAGPAAPVPVADRPRRSRLPRRGSVWALAAAAAAVVVAGSLVLSPRAEVRATAQLDPFPDWPEVSGTASVVEDRDGGRTLDVTIEGDDLPDGGAIEAWLIDPETADLISLGFLDADRGAFVVPASVDLDRFSLVDVSAEPDDGDPAHSGDSIVRGRLQPGGAS